MVAARQKRDAPKRYHEETNNHFVACKLQKAEEDADWLDNIVAVKVRVLQTENLGLYSQLGVIAEKLEDVMEQNKRLRIKLRKQNGVMPRQELVLFVVCGSW
jgi:hypothetical protein